MRYSWIVLLIVRGLLSPADGQVPSSSHNVEPPRLKLLRKLSIPSEKIGAISGSTKCDSEGNVYFRRYQPDRPHLGPVIKVSSTGERKAIFAPSALNSPPLTEATYFNIGPNNQLYWVGFGPDRKSVFVARFNKDGSPGSEIKLDEEFIPFQFAVFKSGEFLLAGVKLENRSVAGTEHPFTAVFSSHGRLLTKLVLEDDDSIMQAAKRGDVSVVSPVNPGVIRALNLGEATTGDDGNVYLLRHLSPAIIYAISREGDVQRITVESPGGLMPIAMQASGESLALVFWDNDTETGTVKLVDMATRKQTASYEYGDPLGPAFACFSSQQERFSFLSGDKENVVLVHASGH